jgi:hypothetical protein
LNDNNIQLEAKIETVLVEVSAGMFAAGMAGLVAVPMIPDPYKAPVTAIFGALAGIGTTMLAVWHKFVNVFETTKKAEQPTAPAPAPTSAPAQESA